jgi:hypothetical protein
VRQASYALAALFVPFVGWYLVAPVAVLFGWTRRAFMRLCSWIPLLLAVLSAAGDVDRAASQRIAWGVAWVAAAAIGFRLSGRVGVDLPARGPLSRLRHRSRSITDAVRPERDPHELIVLCERRLGKPVDTAVRLRVKTPSGARTHVLALAAGYLWWIELHPWRTELGPILCYRSLQGLAAHTERRRGGRHVVELSWPSSGELFVGTLYGPGADRLAGQLAADQFARARASVPASAEGR